ACGAPLGAWVASRTHRDVIVGVLVLLIVLEAVTTTTLIGWSGSSLGLGCAVALGSTVYFAWMLHRRHAAFRRARK
ncbi:MAG: hypothetical protein HKO57_14195, partial [Akkermansiaceae bacterium]|nr:hypothetical protein [Akkermansiaceae bacterium]